MLKTTVVERKEGKSVVFFENSEGMEIILSVGKYPETIQIRSQRVYLTKEGWVRSGEKEEKYLNTKKNEAMLFYLQNAFDHHQTTSEGICLFWYKQVIHIQCEKYGERFKFRIVKGIWKENGSRYTREVQDEKGNPLPSPFNSYAYNFYLHDLPDTEKYELHQKELRKKEMEQEEKEKKLRDKKDLKRHKINKVLKVIGLQLAEK